MATRTSYTNRIIFVNDKDDVDTSIAGIYIPYNDWQLIQVGLAFWHLNNEAWRIESQRKGEVVINNGKTRRRIVRNDWKNGSWNYHTYRPAQGAKDMNDWVRHPIDKLMLEECTRRSQDKEVFGQSHLWNAKAMSKYAIIAHVLLGRKIFVQTCFRPEDYDKIPAELYAPIKKYAECMTMQRVKFAYDYESKKGQRRGSIPNPMVQQRMRDFVRGITVR